MTVITFLPLRFLPFFPGLFLSAQAYEANLHESLSETAQQCRQEVDQLWTQQHYVPQEQRRDFHIAIKHASKNCDDLREILSHLKQANALKQAYEQSITEAKILSQKSPVAP